MKRGVSMINSNVNRYSEFIEFKLVHMQETRHRNSLIRTNAGEVEVKSAISADKGITLEDGKKTRSKMHCEIVDVSFLV